MIEGEGWWKIWDWGGVILLCRHCREALAAVVISKGAVDRRRGVSGTTFCVSNSLQPCLDDLRISPKQSRAEQAATGLAPKMSSIVPFYNERDGPMLKGPTSLLRAISWA